MYSVYWIHSKDHTDIFRDGYIGVSNNTEKRFTKHKTHAKTGKHINPLFSNAVNKHGWDNLIKEVVLIAEKQYCLEIEAKLRPNKEIGWNLATGGGMPNVKFGQENPMCNPEIAAKTSASKKGIATRGYGWHHSNETKQKISKAKKSKAKVGKKVFVKGTQFISLTSAAKHFGIHIKTLKKRLKTGEF